MSEPRASGPWVSWTFAPRCGVLDENGSSGPEAKAFAHLRDLENYGQLFLGDLEGMLCHLYMCECCVRLWKCKYTCIYMIYIYLCLCIILSHNHIPVFIDLLHTIISQNKKSMTKLTQSVTLFVSSRQAPDLHASRAPVQGHVHELPLSPWCLLQNDLWNPTVHDDLERRWNQNMKNWYKLWTWKNPKGREKKNFNSSCCWPSKIQQRTRYDVLVVQGRGFTMAEVLLSLFWITCHSFFFLGMVNLCTLEKHQMFYLFIIN